MKNRFKLLKLRKQIDELGELVDFLSIDICEVINNIPFFKNNPLLPFNLRLYQKNIFHQVFVQNRKKFFLNWCRRAGKDACCFSIIATLALIERAPYVYLLPYNVMVKRNILRGGIHSGTRFYFFKEFFPKNAIKRINMVEMAIELVNGSIIYMAGTDNYDRLRGGYIKAAVFSEYAFGKDGALDALSPSLSQANGLILINSTPRGYNFSWEAFQKFTLQDDWYCETGTCENLLDEEGNRYITEAIVQDSINNGMSPGKVRQEFYCEPYLDKNELYFAEELTQMIEEKRWRVPQKDLIIPGIQCHYAFDLGMSDPTVIIFFQVAPNKKVHIISYHNEVLKTWRYYAEVMHRKTKALGLRQGIAFLPFDCARRERGTDTITTAESNLNELGFYTKPVGFRFKDDAISQAKDLLTITKIGDHPDLQHFKDGMQAYTRETKNQGNDFTGKPKHDWASHIADAYMVLSAAFYQGIRSM